MKLQDRNKRCESYSRCENLILRGIEAGSAEDYDSCKCAVLNLLCQCMPGRQWTEDYIVGAHRLGKVSVRTVEQT